MRLPFLHALRKKFGYLSRGARRAARECALSTAETKLQKKKGLFQEQSARDASPRGAIRPGSGGRKTRLVAQDKSPPISR
jgi:hypothetical protein